MAVDGEAVAVGDSGSSDTGGTGTAAANVVEFRGRSDRGVRGFVTENGRTSQRAGEAAQRET